MSDSQKVENLKARYNNYLTHLMRNNAGDNELWAAKIYITRHALSLLTIGSSANKLTALKEYLHGNPRNSYSGYLAETEYTNGTPADILCKSRSQSCLSFFFAPVTGRGLVNFTDTMVGAKKRNGEEDIQLDLSERYQTMSK